MVNKDRLLNTFFDYVRINSESGSEKEIVERLVSDLKALGFSVYTDHAGAKCNSTGNNVYCLIDGTLNAEPILFGAHMDTVEPGKGVEPVIDGDVIRSKGDTVLGGDDKSGISVIMEALRLIVEHKLPHRPLDIVFTIREETGLLGACNLEYERLRANKAIVMDSAGYAGSIKTKAPGLNRLHFKVFGKKSHAGACPEDGISAILVAAEAISHMKLLRIDEETTANIGSIMAPGATNIVNAYAEVSAEARSFSRERLDSQTQHMIDCFQTTAVKYGAVLEHTVSKEFEPYALPDNHYLVSLIKDKCEKFGMKAYTCFDGGGSDANVYAKNGIEAVAIGNGMDLVHTTNEYLRIKDFVEAVEIVLAVMTEV